MKRQWVIADIHGCAKSLKNLVENQIQLKKSDELYLLGDYIDRGPDSKGVIDYIIGLQQKGFKVTPLKGNHEDVLLTCYAQDKKTNQPHTIYDLKAGWFKHGGKATLKSFGAESILEIPKKYIDFMAQLPHYTILDKFILVHAGFNFKLDNPFLDQRAMLWIKSFRVDKSKTRNRRIIHGHIPHSLSKIKYQLKNADAISLDNGCVYEEDGRGNLLALELNTLELKIQHNIDVPVVSVHKNTYFSVAA